MKKIFAIITVVTLLLSLCSVAAFAAEQPTVRVSQETAAPGETAAVEVSIENNPGIVTMTLKVEFDETVLTLKGAEDKGGLGNAAHKRELESPYILRWSNNTVKENYTFNGTAVVLTFEVAEGAADGVYPVTVSYDYDNYDIIDWQMNKINFSVANGSVTVENTGTDTPDTDGVSVSGNVTKQGNVSADAVLSLYPENSSTAAYETVLKADETSYSFGNVAAGSYTLKAVSDKYDTVTAAITVGDTDVTKDLTLKPKFRLVSATMVLDNSITMSYSINSSLATVEGYSDFYLKLKHTENNGSVTEDTVYPAVGANGGYEENGGKYRFYFGLRPEQLGDTFTAVLYAKDKDGNEAVSAEIEYGAYKYALSRFASGSEELKALLVNMLHYGDEAQKYVGYKENQLASDKAGMTSEIKAAYLKADRSYTNVTNKNYETVAVSKAEFKSATLILGDKIDLQYKILLNDSSMSIDDVTVRFKVLDYDGVTVKRTVDFTNAKQGFAYDSSNGRYTIVFDELIPNELSNKVLATVYVGDTAVSNTLCYSVESYIEGKYDDAFAGDLIMAIMKYGDAVRECYP